MYASACSYASSLSTSTSSTDESRWSRSACTIRSWSLYSRRGPLPRADSSWMRFHRRSSAERSRLSVVLFWSCALVRTISPNPSGSSSPPTLSSSARRVSSSSTLRDTPRALVERHEHEVAAGERDVGGRRGALLAGGVLGDLDEDRPAALEHLLDVGALPLVALAVVRRRDDVVGLEKRVPLGAVLDERGVEAVVDVRHHPAVDVAPIQSDVGGLHLERFEHRSVDDCNADLGLALRVDEHSSCQLELPHGGRHPSRDVACGPSCPARRHPETLRHSTRVPPRAPP